MDTELTYIDLFAGCGGLSLGLHNAGWKGLFAIEKSPDAFKTLEYNLINKKKHFSWPEWLGKPTNLEINQVIKDYKEQLIDLQDKVTMVAGGPPCQGFSMAGRRNENDQRNNLINSYIEFIELVKPQILFFENVKGFTLAFKKNKQRGVAYSSIVAKKLEHAGYNVYGKLVNFGDYGVPQKRTRFILVGLRKDLPGSSKAKAETFFDLLKENKFNFLKKKGLKEDTCLSDAISDLLKGNGEEICPDSPGFTAGLYSEAVTPYQKLMRKRVKKGVADSHRFPKHRPDIISKFDYILKTEKRKNKDISAEIREKFKIKKHSIIPLDRDDKSPTITTLPDDYIHYSEPRILTVREYARIQSFPDSYEFKGKYTTGGEKRTQEVPRYTQIGNAIPPLFGELSGQVLKFLVSVI